MDSSGLGSQQPACARPGACRTTSRPGIVLGMAAPDMERAHIFGTLAEEYAQWRPTYPDVAVEFLCPSAPACVVDLGAGTGQLTGALLDRGLTVDAVDTDADMLRVLTRNFPAVRTHVARSDALPFADASVEAVLVATAFHWFPFEETIAEVRRVLKPGGWLGLIYNLVTPVHDWERELGVTNPDDDGATSPRPEPSWPFPPPDVLTARFAWDWHVSPEHYRNALATNSAVMKLPDAERRATLDAAEEIVRRACDGADSPTAPVHHEAFCLKWVARPTPA